jgi:hypothetical protein
MSLESQILLTNISTESQDSSFLYSEKKQGAGYNRRSSNLHTLIYFLDNFSGTIKIQGTLSLNPAETDWADIENTEIGGDSSFFSDARSITFSGNFVWLRAAYNLQNGTITEIRYNF